MASRADARPPDPAVEAPPDRTVRAVIDAEPQHLNPLLDPDLWGYRVAHNLLCEPLVQPRSRPGETPPAADQPGRYQGVLAERFRIEPDGRGIDLWVRKGVRFHDGHPLTAADVRATLEMVMRSGASAPRTQALLADVVRVLPIGKDGVHLDLRRPTGPARATSWILAALSEIDILPANQFLGGKLAYQPFNRRPVCTGPFRLAEWKRGSHLLLRRSPTYWGTPPAAEALRLLIVPDGARGLAELRQGEADVLLRVAPRYLADQVEPAVERGRWRKVELDANQVVALVWNGRHPALAAPGVRRALAAHIDRLRLVREVRAGLGTPLSAPLMSAARSPETGAPAARSTEAKSAEVKSTSGPGAISGSGLGAGAGSSSIEQSLAALSPFLARSAEWLASAAPARPELTLAEAGELLDAAGAVRLGTGGSGPRLFQGRPLTLRALVPAGSTELAEVSRRIGESLQRAGLKWETEVVELSTLTARLRQGNFDAALLAWSWTGGPDELELEPLLHLALGDKSPLLADLVSALRARPAADAALDPPGRPARLTRLWDSEQPITLLYRTRQLTLLSPAVGPLPLPTLGDMLDLSRIYLDRPPPSHAAAELTDSGLPSPQAAGLPGPLVSPAGH